MEDEQQVSRRRGKGAPFGQSELNKAQREGAPPETIDKMQNIIERMQSGSQSAEGKRARQELIRTRRSWPGRAGHFPDDQTE
jgi:hypothetical protein